MTLRFLGTAFAMSLPILAALTPNSALASDNRDIAGALLGGIALGVIASELLDKDDDRHHRSYNRHHRHEHRKYQSQSYKYGDRHNNRARHHGQRYHKHQPGYHGRYDYDRR
ncbi:hypothetical protein [Roseovarius rhodophyticola]|uniref:Uncharacterized protein n=1 Tax=Roseovarius rhodophyticola TaxID=3080827 RepID=A0ABZ2TEP6_9RHOB|nr:hypothetical protein [Roseovarius sp. W115]MDV2927979.1 hypothetical protein [Roseovarius sp. W115]